AGAVLADHPGHARTAARRRVAALAAGDEAGRDRRRLGHDRKDGQRAPEPGTSAADRPAGTRLPLWQRRRGRKFVMTTGRRRADSSGEDELLSRLYQQVTEQQAARFAAGYDMAAGLGRYRAWLGEHTAEEPARPQAIPVAVPAALRATFADSGAGIVTTGTLLAGAPLEPVPAEWDAARAVTAIYTAHYRPLVRLAVLLVRDVATAEEIVQDSFIAMHATWRQPEDGEKALSYLRQSVVNRSRTVLRHRVVVD